MKTKYDWEKTTEIYWTSKEFYGYEDTWDNNVGGCQNDFYGVCHLDTGNQEVPCVFCRKNGEARC